MTLRQLASAIAKQEGKKSQARIGDIREILKILTTMEAVAKGSVEKSPCVAIAKAAGKVKVKLDAI